MEFEKFFRRKRRHVVADFFPFKHRDNCGRIVFREIVEQGVYILRDHRRCVMIFNYTLVPSIETLNLIVIGTSTALA